MAGAVVEEPNMGSGFTPREEQRGRLRTFVKVILASLVFCVASITSITMSKMALVDYKCPLLLAITGQLLATMTPLLLAECTRRGPRLSLADFKSTIAHSFLYFLSLLLGLDSTRRSSFVAYILLQWSLVLFVGLGQVVACRVYETLHINAAIAMMIVGCIWTALHYARSLFDGWAFVVGAAIASAAYILATPQMARGERVGGVAKLLLCNVIAGLCQALVLAVLTGDLGELNSYPHWTNRGFMFVFLMACVFEAITRYATMALFQLTSALNFAVLGGVRSLIMTYIGVYMSSEYTYELPPLHFLGTQVTAVGCMFYIYSRIHQDELKERKKWRLSPPAFHL